MQLINTCTDMLVKHLVQDIVRRVVRQHAMHDVSVQCNMTIVDTRVEAKLQVSIVETFGMYKREPIEMMNKHALLWLSDNSNDKEVMS